ncbi:MAG TPA: hypothetical protein DHM37_03815 [Candidatus Cloacimonas sp.]|nr:hypothetical protein [Candidatus Cloacimonas sp.]
MRGKPDSQTKVIMLNKLNSMLWGKALQAYVISRNPIIIISFWYDFINNLEAFLEIIPEAEKVILIFKCGHYKSRESASEIAKQMQKLSIGLPKLDYYVLANSQEELQNFFLEKVKAVFVNQNAFLDEKRYKILNFKKKYKAVYLARFSPIKRHYLAKKIDNILFIGNYSKTDKTYFQETMLEFGQKAVWKRKIFALRVPYYFNKAHVGLILSEVEGASYVTTEYLLCGLPVVSTLNKGGRNVFLQKYGKLVEADPEAVQEAVEEFIDKKYSAEDIRETAIMHMKQHRKRFIELINKIYAEAGVNKDFAKEWDKVFTHKMGLRCGNWPWIYRKRILKESERIA